MLDLCNRCRHCSSDGLQFGHYVPHAWWRAAHTADVLGTTARRTEQLHSYTRYWDAHTFISQSFWWFTNHRWTDTLEIILVSHSTGTYSTTFTKTGALLLFWLADYASVNVNEFRVWASNVAACLPSARKMMYFAQRCMHAHTQQTIMNHVVELTWTRFSSSSHVILICHNILEVFDAMQSCLAARNKPRHWAKRIRRKKSNAGPDPARISA